MSYLASPCTSLRYHAVNIITVLFYTPFLTSLDGYCYSDYYGGAAQLEVGYLTVRVSWPSALHCDPCPTHCIPIYAPLLSPPQLQQP